MRHQSAHLLLESKLAAPPSPLAAASSAASFSPHGSSPVSLRSGSISPRGGSYGGAARPRNPLAGESDADATAETGEEAEAGGGGGGGSGGSGGGGGGGGGGAAAAVPPPFHVVLGGTAMLNAHQFLAELQRIGSGGGGGVSGGQVSLDVGAGAGLDLR